MAQPIDRIRAKVTRAKQHLEDFQLAARAFADTKPYSVGVKEDAEAGKRIYYLTKIDEVPLNVAAIAADALGNLREAVDHIAYQLELAACGAPPKHRVYFPIADSAAQYPALRARNIQCAGQAAVDAIDATEPYQGGKGHGLWQLNSLKKSDKHHLLVATSPSSYGIDTAPDLRWTARRDGLPSAFQQAMAGMSLFIGVKTSEPLHVGYELYIEPLDHEVQEDRLFTFDIAFDQPGVIGAEAALKTLQDLTNLVDGLVSTFEPLLP